MEKRVLLVEADGKRRVALRDALAACGMSVRESPSASEAIGLAQNERYDGLLVADESRQLALKGLCGAVRRGHAQAQLFVLLQPRSVEARVSTALGDTASLVPSHLSPEEVAMRVVTALGSHAPALWAYERLSVIRRSRLWETQHARKNGGPSVLLAKLAEQFARDVELRAEFLQAARRAASVEHRGLFRTIEVGGDDDLPFVATHIVPGELLSGLLARLDKRSARLSPGAAAHLVRELALALEAVHAAGQLHSALSPETVWVASDGQVHLLHLGVAGVVGSLERAMQSSGPAPGQAYLAPEHVRGEALDPRSDLFVLGALLYELLAGRPLFGRRDAQESARAILEARIPELDPAVPDALVDVTMACLERQPSFRPPTAGALARRLSQALAARPTPMEDEVTEERPGFFKRVLGAKESEPRAPTPPPAGAAARAELADLVRGG